LQVIFKYVKNRRAGATTEGPAGTFMTTETATAPAAASPQKAAAKPRSNVRAFWLRQIMSWHWISAAISLTGMIVFAITGITLNHAGDIAATPVVHEQTATLPANLLASLPQQEGRHALPALVAAWADREFAVSTNGRDAEWSADEVYLAMARPGGDAWISIDRASGEVVHEDTWRGWVAYFNDLHKGRNTGPVWAWFIDIFAVACVFFCLTGLGLLWLKAAGRPVTWPLVTAGVIIPLILALFLIH
jgi:hypothetical protein